MKAQNVTIAARNRDRLEQTEAQIASTTSVTINVAEMDITQAESVNAVVKSILDRTGRIDAVVNSAVDVVGGLPGAPSEMDVEGLGSAFDVKVLGILRVHAGRPTRDEVSRIRPSHRHWRGIRAPDRRSQRQRP